MLSITAMAEVDTIIGNLDEVVVRIAATEQHRNATARNIPVSAQTAASAGDTTFDAAYGKLANTAGSTGENVLQAGAIQALKRKGRICGDQAFLDRSRGRY